MGVDGSYLSAMKLILLFAAAFCLSLGYVNGSPDADLLEVKDGLSLGVGQPLLRNTRDAGKKKAKKSGKKLKKGRKDRKKKRNAQKKKKQRAKKRGLKKQKKRQKKRARKSMKKKG